MGTLRQGTFDFKSSTPYKRKPRTKPFGQCKHCKRTAQIVGRGLCKKCFGNLEIRKQYPTLCCTFDDLTGRTFGRLTVLGQTDEFTRHGVRKWLCKCSCPDATLTKVTRTQLISGNTKSCGCWKRETAGDATRKHGQSRTYLHQLWTSIKDRCFNPNNERYADYGGRGIMFYAEWDLSFETFAAAIGHRPSARHSLDRIDGNKGYEPGNVRWATQKEQCRNLRTNRLITHNGRTMSLGAWAEECGVHYRILARRLDRGMPVERALQAKDHRRRPGGRGAAMSSEKGTYYAMHRRCEKSDDESYPAYGARGIFVCDRWSGKEGFKNFLADMGLRPGKGFSLERRDTNGPYSPDNCRWATAKEQARNLRSNRIVEFQGRSLPVAQWAEILGLPDYVINVRLRKGWSVEDALTKPLKITNRYKD